MNLINRVEMVEFESISNLNNFTKNRLVQIESIQTIVGKSIKLNTNQLKQWVLDAVVMIKLVDNL